MWGLGIVSWEIIMFCINCGKEIDTGSKFCQYCGAVQPLGNGEHGGTSSMREASKSKSLDGGHNDDKPHLWAFVFVSLLIVALVAGVVFFQWYKGNSGTDFRGEWLVISNDGDGHGDDNLNFFDEGNCVIEGFNGTYTVDEENSEIRLNVDIGVVVECHYIISYPFLVLRDTDDEFCTVYINLDRASAELAEGYYYAWNAYEEYDPYDYLWGEWTPEGSLEGNFDFELYEKDGDFHMVWDPDTLPMPSGEEDEGFSIDGDFKVTVDGLDALLVIPIADDKAYFYCYENDTLKLYEK